MGYFQVIYDCRVINYDRRGFIRLATDLVVVGGDSCHVPKVVSLNPGTIYCMDIFHIYLL